MEDLPVKIVILRLGIRKDTFFRVFSRAPRMSRYSWDTIRSVVAAVGSSHRLDSYAYYDTLVSGSWQKVDHALRLLQQLLDVSQARAGTLISGTACRPGGRGKSARPWFDLLVYPDAGRELGVTRARSSFPTLA